MECFSINKEIRQRLASLIPKEKVACLVLARGQGGPSALMAIEKEYPYLAWALIESELDTIMIEHTKAIDSLQHTLNNIREWRKRRDHLQN